MKLLRPLLPLLALLAPLCAQDIAVSTRHAPSINGNARVEGSVQMVLGENVTLNGGATLTQDLLVPGTPTLDVQGSATWQGAQPGSGDAAPTGYTVRLQGGAALRYVRTRTNAVTIPNVPAPPASAGTRSVTLTQAGQSAGDWATVRDLSVQGNAGAVAVSAGTYRNLSANGSAGFIFGVVGATQPAVYELQTLSLNGQAAIQVVGPVILHLKNGLTLHGLAGVEAHPEWLQLRIATGGVTINGGATLHGSILAPSGEVKINGQGRLCGTAMCDSFRLNGGGLVRWCNTSGGGGNRPPVATPQSGLTTVEDVALPIALAGSDPDNDPLTFAVTVQPQHGTVSGTGASVLYTPDEDYFGPDSFSFTVADGTMTSAPAAVSLTVTPENDVPVAQVHAVSTTEETPVTFELMATDRDGDALTYEVVTGPAHGTLSAGTGPHRLYTPALAFSGEDSFTFRVHDGTAYSGIVTVPITVVPVPDEPVAGSFTVTTPEEQWINVTLTGVDDDGDALTFRVVTLPAHGVLAGTAPHLVYQPAPDFDETDSFTYVASDGTRDSAPATVTIDVTPVNDAPVATSFTVETDEDTPVTFALKATDVDGDALTYEITAMPTRGTISGTAPNFTYTPAPNAVCTDTLTFIARDAETSSAPAVVTFVVRAQPDVPVAHPQSVALDEDTSLLILLTAEDADGDPLIYGIVTPPAHGPLAATGDPAAFLYTPHADYDEADSFTFAVNDGTADSAPALVAIAIRPLNDAPRITATAPSPIVAPAAIALQAVATDDGDPAGSVLTLAWSKVSGPGDIFFANATSAGTTASYTLAGTYVLRATASDTDLSASAEVTVVVTIPNQPPVVDAGTAQTIALAATTNLLGTVTDDDLPTGAALTQQWSTLSGPGTVTFGNAGALTTSATFTAPGDYVLRLRASDTLLSGQDEIAIHVIAPNAPPQVTAGSPFSLPIDTTTALAGAVTDDGLPRGAALDAQWTLVSGPGAVTFGDPFSPTSTVRFSAAGAYTLRLTASDTERTASAEVTVTATAPANQAPTIHAGPDRTTDGSASLFLAGTVIDDSLPAPAALTVAWTKVSGPGAVAFASPQSAATGASFSAPGAYVLRLTANDGALTASDDVAISVTIANAAPVVDAGPDQTAVLEDGAFPQATASDDGQPAGAPLVFAWRKISGPGTITVTPAGALRPRVIFSEVGDYVLELSVSDGELSGTDQVAVTVASRCFAAPANLAAHWPAEGDADDALGRNPGLLRGGTSFVPGKVGSAFFFDGIDDDVRIPASPSTDIGAAAGFTIEGWVKLADLAANRPICEWGTNGTGVHLFTSVSAPGHLHVNIRGDDGTNNVLPLAYTDLTPGQFHHIALTFDRNSGVARLYRDGVQVSGAPFPRLRPNTAGDLYLGSRGNLRWSGAIDEFSLYTRALSAGEIVALHASGLGKCAPPPGTTLHQPPVISAGADRSVPIFAPVRLDGSFSDDGRPLPPTLTATWRVVSGPAYVGDVEFSDIHDPRATVDFPAGNATYVLRLTVRDGEFMAHDDVTFVVTPEQTPTYSKLTDWQQDWRYKVYAHGTVPANVAASGFDASDYATGRAAFASGGGCPLQVTRGTHWPADTDIVIRRTFILPPAVTNVRVQGSIDNFVRVWINGVDVSGGMIAASPCNGPGSFNFNFPISAAVQPGLNHIVVQGRDVGIESLLDARVVADWLFAVAGPDQSVPAGSLVTLDGTGSGNAYGTGLVYHWLQIEGAPIVLDTTDPARPTFPAPARAAAHRVRFQLWVESGGIVSTPDEVSIDVAAASAGTVNLAPVVSAGPDRDVFAAATLAGSVSDDGFPAGAPVTVRWSVAFGPGPVSFSDPSAPVTTASFVVGGQYLLRLTASDGQWQVSDVVTVWTRAEAPENLAPVVSAGPDRSAVADDVLALSSTATDDGRPAGSTLTRAWSRVSGPGVVAFSAPASASTGAVFSAPGIYRVRFAASDSVLTSSDETIVTVAAAATNRAPTVNLGADRSVPFGQTVSLAPQVEDDGQPAGGVTVSFGQSAGPLPLGIAPEGLGNYTLSFPSVGVYAVRLRADDGQLSASDEVTVTVTPAATAPPTVALTAPTDGSSYQAGQPIGLQATASDPDAGGGILRVDFYDGATLLGSVTGGQGSYSWTGAALGAHTLTAVATDASGTTANSAVVVVNVTPPVPAIALTHPVAYSAFAPGESVAVQATASSGAGGSAIAQVEFLLNGSVLAVDPSAPYSTTWIAPAFGDYTLTARATDAAGQTATSGPVLVRVVADPTAPTIAELDPAQDGATITAPTPLLGTVDGPTLASWKLEYRREGSTCADWITFASGTESVPAGGTLGTFDPTKLLNGIYAVRLVARDAFGGALVSEQRLVVEGDMKVGHFTVAFSDLSVSLAGLPLTVTRIYDSRELCPNDFGHGWKLDVESLRLEKSHPMGDAWEIESVASFNFSQPSYHQLIDAGPHALTVRMPDGEVLRFSPKLVMNRPYSRLGSLLDADGDDVGQVWLPIQYDQSLKLRYRPRGGTKGATLAARGYRAFDPFGGTGAMTLAGDAPLYVSENLHGPIALAAHENSAQDAPLVIDATGWELTSKDGRKFTFDETGRLESMRDPQGNVLAIVQDAARRVQRVTHSSGKEIVFVRNAQGFITEVIDPAGNRCHYTYDAAGDLRAFHNRVTDPLTQPGTQQFSYTTGTHYLTDLFDGKGVRAAKNYYDAEGRIQRTVDADGKETIFTHNIAGRTETIRDRAGNTTTHRYDERGNIVETTTPDGTRTVTAYHTYSEGRKSDLKTNESITGFFTQADGSTALRTLTSTYSYEDEDPGTPPADDGLLRKLIDPLGHVTSFTYDARGNALSITDALNRTTTNSYYPDSTLLQSTTDAAGTATSFTYDAKGMFNTETRTVTVVDETGASVVQTLVTDHDYDANGYLVKMTDARGHVTTYENDAHGNRLFERTTRSADGLVRNVESEHTYDANDRLVKSWDAEHPRITNPDPTSETLYDENGKPSVVYDALRRTTQMTYTARGELQTTTHADGTSESVTYDAEGRREYTTDRRGKVTRTIYDPQGRVGETWFLGSGTDTPVRLSATTYAAAGRVHTSTDANNRVTTNVFDDSGRRVGMIDALAQASAYQYDANGNLRYFTDAKGRLTEHQYDVLNRRVATLHPAADLDINGDGIIGSGETNVVTTTQTAYDELGRRVAETDANGRTKRFVYDQLGRLTHVVDYAGQVTAYTYDEIGNQLTQTDANNHTTNYSYDDLAGW